MCVITGTTGSNCFDPGVTIAGTDAQESSH